MQINWKTRTSTDFILIHSTGTEDDIGAHEIRRDHLAKGWLDLAYHFVIRRSGAVEPGRIQTAPAGYKPSDSVAICLVGSEEITAEQALSLRRLVISLMFEYPEATVYPRCKFTNFTITKGDPINGIDFDIVRNPAPAEPCPSLQGGQSPAGSGDDQQSGGD